jgi:hypothetical protein
VSDVPSPPVGGFPGWRSGLLAGLAGRVLTPPAGRAANRVYVFFDPSDPSSGAFLGSRCPRLLDSHGIEQFWAPVSLEPGSAEGGMAFLGAGAGSRAGSGPVGALAGSGSRPGEAAPGRARILRWGALSGMGTGEYMDFLELAASGRAARLGCGDSPVIANTIVLTRLAGRLEGRGRPALVWLEGGELKCLFGVTRASALGERVAGMRRGPLPLTSGEPRLPGSPLIRSLPPAPRPFPERRRTAPGEGLEGTPGPEGGSGHRLWGPAPSAVRRLPDAERFLPHVGEEGGVRPGPANSPRLPHPMAHPIREFRRGPRELPARRGSLVPFGANSGVRTDRVRP